MPPKTSPSPPPGAPSRNIHEDMLESGEQLLSVIHRHPIGIVLLYLEALVGVIAIIALFAVVAPDALNSLSPASRQLVIAGAILGVAMLVFFLFIATYVYRQSRLLITDRGLIQVTQTTLFIRKVTRLSFSNVEDVSSEIRGILATIFNFGTLLVQTAGTMDNFEFKYCPNPNKYADIIIEARQHYAEALKEEPGGG